MASRSYPAWKKVMKWLREADQVETLAINGDSFVFEEIPENFRAFMDENAKDSKWVIHDVEGERKKHIIDVVESWFYETDGLSLCAFRPHHYFIGRKGSDSLIVQLCFECGLVRTKGAIERSGFIDRENKGEEIPSLFGIGVDVSPMEYRKIHFPPPEQKPKQSWPIGGT